MAETKGYKSSKEIRPIGLAWQKVATGRLQTHRPKKWQKWGKPMPSPIKAKRGYRKCKLQNETRPYINGKNGMRKKEDKIGSNGTITSWPKHHQPISNQCKGGGSTVKGFAEGVVWWRGENGLFMVSNQGLFWEVLCWEDIFVQNRW